MQTDYFVCLQLHDAQIVFCMWVDVMRDDLDSCVESHIEGAAVQHIACRRVTYINTPVTSATDAEICGQETQIV